MTFFSACGRRAEQIVSYCLRPLTDAVTNRRYATADQRILLVRHRAILSRYYNHFLRWVAREFPDERRRFQIVMLPCRIRDWSSYRLMTAWIIEESLVNEELTRRRLLELEEHCKDHDIPVINPVAGVLNATKADCARVVATTGMRTPRTEVIEDMERFKKDLAGMEPPLLVRTNLGHAGIQPMYHITNREDIHRFPLHRIEDPIAMEFIDVRSPKDGLVRKYRYQIAGSVGVSSALQISRHWEVRGKHRLDTKAAIAEERRYTSTADPNHDLFQKAARTLGLQFLAFDYSYDQDGRIVVWEINTMPSLRDHLRRGEIEHLISQEVARAATLWYFLTSAGFEIPEKLRDKLREGVSGLDEAPAR